MDLTRLGRVLSIAGSDSGGGAGIQADIKTLTSLHVYATTAITSVTSQNTLGVNGIHDIPASFVEQQIKTVMSDIGTDSIKIGMLSSAEIIHAVANTLKQYYVDHIVVDPVMVSTSGSALLAPEAKQALIQELLPMSFILTPNVPEAETILDMETGSIQTVEDMVKAAKQIAELGPRYVLLKGGHLPITTNEVSQVIDVFYSSESGHYKEFVNEFVETTDSHGTGCTLSSAIAGELAKGVGVDLAVKNAINYVQMAIKQPFIKIGRGNGPINHFHNMKWSPYENQSLISAIKDRLPDNLWSDFIHHPFVQRIGDGTLPTECFIHYLKQDYLYLQQYARAASLAAYKSSTLEEIGANASIVVHIAKESQLHIEYCAQWGITKEEVLNTTESVFNSAYTRFVLDKGATGDLLDLKVAMSPCLLGYGEIGLHLFNDPATKREGNPYWKWICQYAADDYQEAVRTGIDELEKLASHSISTSETRFDEVVRTFEQATRLEIMFWEMGLNCN
ncbi:Phosphomethylpyrimidine kinase-domain-containing protein [Pilobolus umbonatus]|nr:Phosphomethylpyrimidine kinase-domain-containing protein [Pilobolus umbonatus]